MRLIDVDALIADLYDEQKHSHLMAPFKLCTADRVDLKFLLNEAPTIDAAPVVRCGECKYCEVVETLIGPDTCCVNQGDMLVHKDVDDYCSWGERREDNGT